ncbi:hypothetical protein [Dokdonella sp.]|uniref:hypothetical protein n=1 Tax=Dokdonella sp. TaxID=2291710 RepID=UPI0031B8101A
MKGIAKRRTASVCLQQLVDLGLLREQKARREKLFVHANVLRLLKSEEHSCASYGQE